MTTLPLRPAAALLSKSALRRNLLAVQRRIRDFDKLHRQDARVMAIVKADAYGHDMDCIVPELERAGVRDFAVASLEEGIEARRISQKAKILVLGGTFDWTPKAVNLLVKNKLKVGVNDIPSLKRFLALPHLELHLKLDTGMNRLGLKPNDWSEALRLIKKSRRPLDGLFTHFATVSDAVFHQQAEVFEEAVRWFSNEGVRPTHIHSENSASLFGSNQVRRGILSEVANLTRPGLSLYGYLPNDIPNRFGLEPVLELVSSVGLIKHLGVGEGVSYGHHYKAKRPHSVGVVPMGYADGVAKSYATLLKPEWRSRNDKKKGSFEVCGAICMDMMMVKALRGQIQAEDRVVFWGRFKNPLLEAGVVEAYELNLRINKRIPRLWGDS